MCTFVLCTCVEWVCVYMGMHAVQGIMYYIRRAKGYVCHHPSLLSAYSHERVYYWTQSLLFLLDYVGTECQKSVWVCLSTVELQTYSAMRFECNVCPYPLAQWSISSPSFFPMRNVYSGLVMKNRLLLCVYFLTAVMSCHLSFNYIPGSSEQ